MSDKGKAALESEEFLPHDIASQRNFYFLLGGMIFLFVAMSFFFASAYKLFYLVPKLVSPADLPNSTPMSLLYIFMLMPFVSSIILIACALACAVLGTKLLKAGGVTTTQVIAPQDMPILGPAVAQANSDAITQWIRLNSLTGWVGFFTKIGLTGLPLATISLTIILCLFSLADNQMFDLAKLTLGAFLGSFVQRQVETGKAQATGDKKP